MTVIDVSTKIFMVIAPFLSIPGFPNNSLVNFSTVHSSEDIQTDAVYMVDFAITVISIPNVDTFPDID